MTESAIVATEIAVEPGVSLRGQLRNGGDAWVVLLHEAGEGKDLDRWSPLDDALAANGWTVLSVDLRGHGASDGEWDADRARADISSIAASARHQGASFLAIAAAGISATHTLRSSAELKADALILLSPAIEPDEPVSDLRGTGEAKLIVVGGGDPAARTCGERLCKTAIGWVVLINLPSKDQGTDLLGERTSPHLVEHALKFLGEQRHIARLRTLHSPEGTGAIAPSRVARTGGENGP